MDPVVLNNFLVDLRQQLSAVADEFNAPPSRDKLAAMAMQGLMVGPYVDASGVAKRAYEIADAMIAARTPNVVTNTWPVTP